jgi:PIN domain nuclease of toxin-antitoxin system
MSRFLLDTMTVLWLALRPDLLGKRAKDALMGEAEFHYSIVSLWEIGIKMSGKGYREFEIPADWERSMPRGLEGQGISRVEIAPIHCRMVQDLPFHHKDPFDRMLIAQALERGLEVIGSDEAFDRYGVRRIW